MKPTQILKRANSKGQLAQAVVFYQRALSHYAKEEHWGVRQHQGDLLHTIGKLAEQEGEAWRLAHPELMDAYTAAMESGDEIVWLGDDDPTYAAQVSLGKRKADPTYLTRNKSKIVRLPDNESTATPDTNKKELEPSRYAES